MLFLLPTWSSVSTLILTKLYAKIATFKGKTLCHCNSTSLRFRNFIQKDFCSIDNKMRPLQCDHMFGVEHRQIYARMAE